MKLKIKPLAWSAVVSYDGYDWPVSYKVHRLQCMLERFWLYKLTYNIHRLRCMLERFWIKSCLANYEGFIYAWVVLALNVVMLSGFYFKSCPTINIRFSVYLSGSGFKSCHTIYIGFKVCLSGSGFKIAKWMNPFTDNVKPCFSVFWEIGHGLKIEYQYLHWLDSIRAAFLSSVGLETVLYFHWNVIINDIKESSLFINAIIYFRHINWHINAWRRHSFVSHLYMYKFYHLW